MLRGLSSAGGLIALLGDEDPQVKIYALERLDEVVDEYWTEISEHISRLEVLYEDESFDKKELAALVVSKVYYNLGSFDDALVYALCAGDLFDVTKKSSYVTTLISKCVDKYTEYQSTPTEKPKMASSTAPDDAFERLAGVINRLFELCIASKKYHEAIGIALETRRLDVVRRCITLAPDMHKTLQYCYRVAVSLADTWQYRNDILRVLAPLFGKLESPDYLNMSHCFIFLEDHTGLAGMLEGLIKDKDCVKQTHHDRVVAYQVAFDLYNTTSQVFCTHVTSTLKTGSVTETATSSGLGLDGNEVVMTTAETSDGDGSSPTTTDEHPPADVASPASDGYKDAMAKLLRILNGERTVELNLQFLVRSNHSDLLVYRHIKDSVRNSVCHNAAIIANGFAHCGTTSDMFLREDLEWLGQAANWAKFTATASLGVIHKGHESEALTLLSTYLPSEGGSVTHCYQDGGGLYALGLIHANHGAAVVDYLIKKLEDNVTDHVIQHGACLGLGLACLGAHRLDVCGFLKNCLLRDEAVVGEAAGMAIGLVMTGSLDSQLLTELINYSQVTQHDKICNGLAVGIPLVMYGHQDKADGFIETLLEAKDQHLRRTAMNSIAMAYCGTGNLTMVEKLLHFAVSDAFGDVRRAAVTAIGFVLCNKPDLCADMVLLLSESFNPYVRCGTAMALGIACAGTGSLAAYNIIEPLFKDPTNFVRQGAYIACAMIMIAQSQGHNKKVADFRTRLRTTVSDSHEESISKFGAIMAQGIIDAGGRNSTIQLMDKAGHLHMPTVVGLLAFQNFWYWFPVSHLLSLAFTPAAVICLNEDLEMPKCEYESWATESTYAYAPVVEVAKAKEKEKVKTAVLSTTHKVQAREAKKAEQKAAKDGVSSPRVSAPMPTPEPMVVDEPSSPSPKEEEEKEARKTWLENPAHVLPAQFSVLKFEYNSRYKPVKKLGYGGIIMVTDIHRGTVGEAVVKPAIDGPEPDPPAPFEWTED